MTSFYSLRLFQPKYAILTALATCVLASCAGTETDNPADPTLKRYEGSACKKESQTPTGQQPLIVASEADGLQCIEWEKNASGTLLTLRLLNFAQGCASRWDGSATLADGKLDLTLTNPKCSVARCGSCLFDFMFEVSGVDTSQPLPLRIGFASCPTAATEWAYSLTLPTADSANGILCRFADAGALWWHARAKDLCETRNMPCGTTCEGSSGCDSGLSCTLVSGAQDYRCLTNCTSDVDCKPGLTTCQDAVCKPQNVF